MTSPSTLQSKARHIKATWGQRCNKLLFMSSQSDLDLPAVGLPVSEGRDNLWTKTRAAFQYIYDHHFDDADWFLKADDDTYVIVENLRHLLQDHDPVTPVYFGRRFKAYVPQGYMSGGAGYVLSKEALRRFVKTSLKDKAHCPEMAGPGSAEDVELGHCLQAVGVAVGDSRDSLGRETFHPFQPEDHLIPGAVPKDNWYWSYNYYKPKEVLSLRHPGTVCNVLRGSPSLSCDHQWLTHRSVCYLNKPIICPCLSHIVSYSPVLACHPSPANHSS